MMRSIYIIFITIVVSSEAVSVNEKYRKFTNVILPTTTSTKSGITITECCQRCSSMTSCNMVVYDVTNQKCEESASSLLISPHTMTSSQGVYITDTKKVYELVRTEMNMISAKTYCATWGGQLMKIDSAEEETLLKSWLDVYGHNHDTSSTIGPWIGLNILAGTGWVWADGYVLQGYTHWGTDQPDNTDGIEKCVHLWFPDMAWNDITCEAMKWSVCEYN